MFLGYCYLVSVYTIYYSIVRKLDNYFNEINIGSIINYNIKKKFHNINNLMHNSYLIIQKGVKTF